MIALTDTDTRFLTDIVEELINSTEAGDLTLKKGVTLYDLIEEPTISIPKVPQEKIDRLNEFVGRNAYLALRRDTSVDNIFTSIIQGNEESIKKVGLTRLAKIIKNMVEQPQNYFKPAFDYNKLSAAAKRQCDTITKDIGVKKDSFEADLTTHLKFKEDVVNNPQKYFKKVNVEDVSKIMERSMRVQNLFEKYKDHIRSNLSLVTPLAERATKDKYANTKEKGWWGKRIDNFYSRMFRTAKFVDQRRRMHEKPTLSSVIENDYGPDVMYSGIVHALLSNKSYKQLEAEMTKQRLADYGRATFNSSIKHPLMFGMLLGGALAYSILDNIPVAVFSFAAGGIALAATARSCENVRKVIAPCPEPEQQEPVLTPTPTLQDCLDKYNVFVPGDQSCKDYCSEYFPEQACPPPPPCKPETVTKTVTRTIYKDTPCPPCSCEDRRR